MGINILLREEWECFYILLREWNENENTVMGMGSKNSFPHISIGKVVWLIAPSMQVKI